jgi:pullulanase
MWHIFFLSALLNSCSDNRSGKEDIKDDKETAGVDLWLDYRKEATGFSIWSPNAEGVKLYLYEKGNEGAPFKTYDLEAGSNGLWRISVDGDLHGTYYTYTIKYKGEWLKETPGIYAKATGVNGNRAMVIDMNRTNPAGWEKDKGPEIKHINEAIIYELHIRDMTIHPESGSGKPGKYLGLVESGTKGPLGVATGIDHLSEMGVTHVHLLPTYDHYSIDETRLDSAQFNWGYDPNNYNVPEGSFSSDPYKAEVRIKEFKTMIKVLHDRGIGVILDVVYNHTGGANENSNFNLEAPGYYYRHWEDGKLSDASACGNETASEKEMMRKFILESVVYWAKEYHMDGFRFDLMGIHDIATMNEVASTLKEVNPNIFVYGEGWTAADSPLPMEQRALKKNINKMPQITAFSDDIRDGLKGSVFEDESTGFVSGAKGMEESVKMGVVGCIEHPQIDYASVNYSDAAWTLEPWQSISYVSCHDNHTLYDKLKVSRKDASEKDIIQMDKLANAVVLTSQGTAFIHAGAELLRTKNGNHNSYNLPDSINQIDWNLKVTNAEVLDYYKNLIKLRKLHPAFRMTTSDELREKLEFKKIENGLISYQISDFANGDTWKNIYVIYNARTNEVKFDLPGVWQVAVFGDTFYFDQNKSVKEQVKVPALSMMIVYQIDAAL